MDFPHPVEPPVRQLRATVPDFLEPVFRETRATSKILYTVSSATSANTDKGGLQHDQIPRNPKTKKPWVQRA